MSSNLAPTELGNAYGAVHMRSFSKHGAANGRLWETMAHTGIEAAAAQRLVLRFLNKWSLTQSEVCRTELQCYGR